MAVRMARNAWIACERPGLSLEGEALDPDGMPSRYRIVLLATFEFELSVPEAENARTAK